MNKEKFIYIGVGGTGARVFESLVYSSAIGLLKGNEISYLLIDQDGNNGNLVRSKECANMYRDLTDGKNLTTSEAFTSKLISLSDELIIPVNEKKFEDVIGYYKNDDLKYIYDVLYTEKERSFNLKDGFVGLPSVGSVGFLKSKEELKKELEKKLGEKENRIIICGSVFGGTGASALSTLPKILKEIGGSSENNKVMNLIVLPYFKVEEGRGQYEVKPVPESFPIKATIAFKFYSEKSKELKIDSSAYIGLFDELQVKVGNFSPGGGKQENRAHFIELLAVVLAKKAFIDNPNPYLNENKSEDKGKDEVLGYAIALYRSEKEEDNYYLFDFYNDDELRDVFIRLDAFLISGLLYKEYKDEIIKVIDEKENIDEKLSKFIKFINRFENYYFSIRFSMLSKRITDNFDEYKEDAMDMIEIDNYSKFKRYARGKDIIQAFDNLFKAIYDDFSKKKNTLEESLRKGGY